MTKKRKKKEVEPYSYEEYLDFEGRDAYYNELDLVEIFDRSTFSEAIEKLKNLEKLLHNKDFEGDSIEQVCFRAYDSYEGTTVEIHIKVKDEELMKKIEEAKILLEKNGYDVERSEK